MEIRLNKSSVIPVFLRREADKLIEEGRVTETAACLCRTESN